MSEFQAAVDRRRVEEIHRLSDLEAFVWMLWRQGVITVEDGQALVRGVAVPDQFSASVVASIEECNITSHEMWSRSAEHSSTSSSPEPAE